MTAREQVIQLVQSYNAGKISLAALNTGLKKAVITDKQTYESGKASFYRGEFDPYLPDELRLNSTKKTTQITTPNLLKNFLLNSYEKAVALMKEKSGVSSSGSSGSLSLQQGIMRLYNAYKAGDLSIDQLKIAIMIASTSDKTTFESLKKAYMSGAYDKYLPYELTSVVQKSNSGLNDALETYDVGLEGLPALDELNAIKQDWRDGKIDENQLQERLLALGRKYPETVSGLVKYDAKQTNLYDFLGKPYDTAKSITNSYVTAISGTFDKVLEAGGKVYEDVKEGASTVWGDTFGMMKWILPVVLIGGGFLVYKLLTSDTAKTVARRV